VLLYNVPPRVGFSKVMWKIGCVHEENLTGKGKGTFFPYYTLVSDFVIAKGGWVNLGNLFESYHLRCGPKRQHDIEGFFTLFRKIIEG
jgi:hypothetical protein